MISTEIRIGLLNNRPQNFYYMTTFSLICLETRYDNVHLFIGIENVYIL